MRLTAIEDKIFLIVYLLPMVLIWLGYRIRHRRIHARASAQLRQSEHDGLTEPASLHPVIDPALCKGCGACVHACPEGDILGLINGKANLVEPANCIGHGACFESCPFDAITLVFGTASRGVDIPMLSQNFETSVPGIYIAGELGGMGLIRNAISQGVQAVEAIAKSLKHDSAAQTQNLFDLIIIGSGPAGIAASLTAKAQKLSYLTVEQNKLGGTVAHFPRNKIVMTAPVNLPLVGRVKLRETSKESLLQFWEQIFEEEQLAVNFEERLTGLNGKVGQFTINTSSGSYRARRVLLCLGRRGTPRTLDIPGEELQKVVYQLTDPEQYRGQRVLVVGGGDSALEAAVALAEGDATVTLSYRGDSFPRAKSKNRQLLLERIERGEIDLRLASEPVSISADKVEIKSSKGIDVIDNDAVIICAGGILPTPFLESIGIDVQTKFGAA